MENKRAFHVLSIMLSFLLPLLYMIKKHIAEDPHSLLRLINLRNSSSMGKIVKVKEVRFRIGQQMVVLKLSMENIKRRKKCIQCVEHLHGVVSASYEGDNMSVVGEGIDAVELTRLLRKKMGYVELLLVTMIKEKKEENVKAEADSKSNTQPFILPYILPLRECGSFKNAQDKLLLWRLNHSRKDGSLSSPEAKQKWKLACQILAEKGLIPEDENIEENERVFKAVMESEHPNSMLCKENFSSDDKAVLCKLTVEISEQSQKILSLQNTVNQLVALVQQQCQVSQSFLLNTTDAGKKKAGAWEDEITEEL